MNTVIILIHVQNFTIILIVFIHTVLLDQACAHCPIFLTAVFKIKTGPRFNPSVADHPFRPAKDRQLGKPLPYQQLNLLKAYLSTIISIFKIIKLFFIMNFMHN